MKMKAYFHIYPNKCIGNKSNKQKKHKKNRQLAIFAGASPTIFAVEVLNFCVRDGNRCFHFAIVTGSFVWRE